MIDVTQEDRDAAAAAQRDAIMRVGSPAEAFARHREQAAAEERAKIVAWLRGVVALRMFGWQHAAAVEAGEHLK